MSGLLGTMSVGFNADTSNFLGGIVNMRTGLAGFINTPMGAMVAGLTAVTAAAVAIGAASVQSASDFQAGMTKVQALAGLSKQETEKMSQSLLDMATQVGQTPQKLSEGLYFVASAGFRGADALNVLKLSAQAAAVGGADTKVVADGLTSALNAFGLSGQQASSTMDMMMATVSAGKMEWSSYANVVGKLSVISHASGVTMAEMNSGLATLTTSGYSAQNASTALGNLFTQLDLKTDSLAKNSKKLGLSFDEQKFKGMSLGQQITYLNTVTGGNASEVLKLLNNNTTAFKTFEALKGSMTSYNATLIQLQNSHGATAKAFETTSQTYQMSMQKMNAAMEVVKIEIGNVLLPVLTQLVSDITPILSAFAQWVSHSQMSQQATAGLNTILKGLGDVFAFLRPYLAQMTDALQTFGQEIAARLQPLIQTFAAFWKATWPGFSTVLKGVWDILVGIVKVAWALFSGIIKIGLDLLSGNWKAVWNDLLDMVDGIWQGLLKIVQGSLTILVGELMAVGGSIAHALGSPFEQAWQQIQGILKQVLGAIQDILGGAQNLGGSISSFLHIPGFASGVQNFSGGLALVGENGPELVQLPSGSSVFPSGTGPSGGTGGLTAGDQYIIVELDGQVLMEAMGNRLARTVRLRTGVKY